MTEPPIRLCCGQRHLRPVCPDGKVMCCLCFKRVEQTDLAVEDGQKVDVCLPCRTDELKRLTAKENRERG